MPPAALVLGAVGSVQFGAALAATLFDEAGPAGTVFLRGAFAALVLVALWRPGLGGHSRHELLLLGAYGLCLGGMNLAFYEAIDRIPLGVAVTFEFVGPLGVAVAGSRAALDFAWVVLAAAGILLLSAPGGSDLDGLGIALALVAGAFWGAYILVAARAGQAFPGGGGLALAMAISAVMLVPFGVADAGSALLEPEVLAIGFAVAMLSSAIPYSLELEALRRIPQHVFGVLMSLEPGVAAFAGFVVLDQSLGTRDAAGIALVMAASIGAARGARTPPPVEA